MRRRSLLLAAAALGLRPAAAQEAAPLTVFAATSLQDALRALEPAWRAAAAGNPPIRFAFAASSALARQIEQGAPADLFISADLDWMDYLEQRNLIRPETRHNLLRNRLVLVASADRPEALELKAGALAKALGDGRLAVANVAVVPAGKYAKAALENLGLWAEVSGRLAQAENVRAALVFVSWGEAPLGIVYETDARADPKVTIVARFPETSHPPIIYPVAVTSRSESALALNFLARVRSRESTTIFAREGFTPLD